ncbi:MAG: hypothetical protein HRT57_15955 [Crocinitomicaceae bacterium]|nr:hypothetical protein [Crocinitomicaceae bacterium]
MNTSIIALIEIGGSHDECLLSQMHAIKATGRKILLITFSEILERNPEFKNYIADTLFVDMSGSKRERGREVSKIWKKIKTSKCEKVVLNTAEGNLVRFLCLKALFSNVKFIGIVHSTRKFERSFTQRIINKKVKKYFLLSENLLNSILPPSKIKVDYFYPLRFPKTDNLLEKGKKTVVIIGGVERRRKDLDGFIEIAQQVKRDDVQFVFLGKSDPALEDVKDFQAAIAKKGLSEKVKTYDHFLSQVDFISQIQNADLILPIVHPNTRSAEEYFKSRISGAMSVSFGYKIPMMLHQGYAEIEEMKVASFYYNMENFGKKLDLVLDTIDTKRAEMIAHPNYNVEFQEARYLDFLFA